MSGGSWMGGSPATADPSPTFIGLLAEPTGAQLVGYNTGTVADELASIVQLMESFVTYTNLAAVGGTDLVGYAETTLTNKLGNLDGDIDDINTALDTKVNSADLASTSDAAKGSSLVAYKTNKTNASGRSLTSRLDEAPSLFDFTTVTNAIANLTTAYGGGVLHMPTGNGATVLPASLGKVLLEYDGPDVNMSMFGEAPSTAWSVAKLYRYQNNAAHAAKGQAAVGVESTVLGSGTNGPTHADYGMSIALKKKDFDTTTEVGEIDALNISVRQGGAASDGCAILANVATYGTGFMGAMEATTSAIAGGVVVEGMQTQIGIVDNVLNKHYGFVAAKNYGVGTGDAYYAGENGTGSWANAMRVNYGGNDVYKVSAAGVLSASSLGYITGSGGTVTQLTSKATSVTINKVCGSIVTHDASLGAGVTAGFAVFNSKVAVGDVIVIHRGSGGTSGSYFVRVDSAQAGAFTVYLQNTSGGALAEAVTLNFAVIKAVTA